MTTYTGGSLGLCLKGIVGQSLNELEYILDVIQFPEHTIQERQNCLACDSTSLLFLSLSIHLAFKRKYMRHI